MVEIYTLGKDKTRGPLEFLSTLKPYDPCILFFNLTFYLETIVDIFTVMRCHTESSCVYFTQFLSMARLRKLQYDLITRYWAPQ